jgi:hypothetical protein
LIMSAIIRALLLRTSLNIDINIRILWCGLDVASEIWTQSRNKKRGRNRPRNIIILSHQKYI